jgi:hypothetical protein
MPKAERDQERIILSLERIADTLQVINNNLAVVAKAMVDSAAKARADSSDDSC